jgi:hypothetical protein
MRRRILKWATLLAVLVLVSISLYWIYVYNQVRYLAAHDDSHNAEAIVVLGAAQYNGRPSKVLGHGLITPTTCISAASQNTSLQPAAMVPIPTSRKRRSLRYTSRKRA